MLFELPRTSQITQEIQKITTKRGLQHQVETLFGTETVYKNFCVIKILVSTENPFSLLMRYDMDKQKEYNSIKCASNAEVFYNKKN